MASTSEYPEYVLPSPLKISTYTMVCNLNNRVDLDIMSRCIPIYEKTDPLTNGVDGTFISISSYSASNTTDYSRGVVSTKIPIKVFNNEITLLYRYWGFKHINLKIFSNGKLQMTGIIDPEFETAHIGKYLINTLKTLKYKIHLNPELSKITNHDFIVIWDPVTQQLDYVRRNLGFQNMDYILQKGIGYNYKADDWQTSTDVKRTLDSFIANADMELGPLEQLRMDLLNTYEYPEEIRMQLYQRLHKFIKVKKLEKKYLKFENKKFMDMITETVSIYISYIRGYKERIQQLINTDIQFITTINNMYGTEIKNAVSTNVLVSGGFIEYDSVLSSCVTYNITNVAVELINSDYNNRFNNNLIKLNELLNSPEYNIYNSYKPNEKYAGIIAKYMYNSDYCDSTKYKEGKCYCEKSCITADKKKCISVSISIFRPGSIIITAGKDVEQLVRVYNYLNALFKKHFDTISYVDVHDNKDHFLLNEERKIMRKENLVYIKKSNIIAPGQSSPSVCITTSTPNLHTPADGLELSVGEKEKSIVPPLSTTTSDCKKELVVRKGKPNTIVQLAETPKLDLSTLCVTVKIAKGSKPSLKK